MQNKINKTPNFYQMAQQAKADIIRVAKVEGVKHFKQSFRRGGFTDKAFQPWDEIKHKVTPSRAVLINSGALRDSIQVFDANDQQIIFGSDAVYARIHNEGGMITVRNTEKSKRFFWFMYKKTGEDHWKWMALSKKSHFKIHMPKRQFLGHSDKLMERLDKKALNIIQKRFKQYINND